ncbi:MAG: hypothetical protein Q9169_006650 [Polycauliona sp. 2 TL-2023]
MSVPWNLSQEVYDAGDKTPHPGGATSYDPPRRIGDGPGDNSQDVTDFHPGRNMPNIIYVYKPPQERTDYYRGLAIKSAPPLRAPNGQIRYEEWPAPGTRPRPLLDYPHLPDRIGTNEWPWVFEAWRRYDHRIAWQDITMRQYGPNRRAGENTVQQLVGRNRKTAKLLSWTRLSQKTDNKDGEDELPASNEGANDLQGEEPNEPQAGQSKSAKAKTARKYTDKVAPLLSAQQIANNTTRGLTPGLIDPTLGEEPGNRIPWPPQVARAGKHKAKKTGRNPKGQGSISQAEMHPTSTGGERMPTQTDDEATSECASEDEEDQFSDLEDDGEDIPQSSTALPQAPGLSTSAGGTTTASLPVRPNGNPRITPWIRSECPANMTPARWLAFLDFCAARNIPEA